jgi:hypothetical protein
MRPSMLLDAAGRYGPAGRRHPAGWSPSHAGAPPASGQHSESHAAAAVTVRHLLVPAARGPADPDAGVTRSDRDVPVFQVAAPARAVGFPGPA